MHVEIAIAAVWVAMGAAASVMPLKGLVLWPDMARERPDFSNSVSLEFSYVLPCDIVKGYSDDGTIVCDWTAVEDVLGDVASRGHQAILRFRYEYPGEELGGVAGATAVPACVKSRADYHETFASNPDGDGPTHYADWSNRALREMTRAFCRSFAAKYDADPRLAFVEVGFGHWAEYHISGTELRPGVNFPPLDYQAAFLREMDSIFKETPWLVSIDAAEPSRSPAAADPGLRCLGFGVFDDSFMHRRHEIAQGDGYNERCWFAFGTNRWQRAPFGGEISCFSRREQREFLGAKGLYGVRWRSAASKYHVTFMIANDAPNGRKVTPCEFAAASALCGWDFRLVGRECGDGRTVLRVRNDGLAPAYHDIRVRLGGVRSAETLRGLLPGEERAVELPVCTEDAPELVSRKFLPGIRVPLARPRQK